MEAINTLLDASREACEMITVLSHKEWNDGSIELDGGFVHALIKRTVENWNQGGIMGLECINLDPLKSVSFLPVCM